MSMCLQRFRWTADGRLYPKVINAHCPRFARFARKNIAARLWISTWLSVVFRLASTQLHMCVRHLWWNWSLGCNGGVNRASKKCTSSNSNEKRAGLKIALHSTWSMHSFHKAKEDEGSGKSFLLATTHLYWGSEHEDVRLWQWPGFLELSGSWFGSGPSDLAVINL